MQAVELNRSDMSHKLVCGLDLFFNQLHLTVSQKVSRVV